MEEDSSIKADGRINQPLSEDVTGRWETLNSNSIHLIGQLKVTSNSRNAVLAAWLTSGEDISSIRLPRATIREVTALLETCVRKAQLNKIQRAKKRISKKKL